MRRTCRPWLRVALIPLAGQDCLEAQLGFIQRPRHGGHGRVENCSVQRFHEEGDRHKPGGIEARKSSLDYGKIGRKAQNCAIRTVDRREVLYFSRLTGGEGGSKGI